MKFDRSRIMQTAWHYRSRCGHSMQLAMSRSWREAKMALLLYNVIGQRFGRPDELIAGGVSYERAGELEEFNRCRYDHIDVVMVTGSSTIRG